MTLAYPAALETWSPAAGPAAWASSHWTRAATAASAVTVQRRSAPHNAPAICMWGHQPANAVFCNHSKTIKLTPKYVQPAYHSGACLVPAGHSRLAGPCDHHMARGRPAGVTTRMARQPSMRNMTSVSLITRCPRKTMPRDMMTTAMQLQTGPRLVDSVRQQAWLTVAGAKALAGWGAAAGDSMRRFHS